MRCALQTFVAQQTKEPVALLGKINGRRIDNGSSHNFVRRHTFQNLSEGDYKKMAVSEIREFDEIE